MSAYASGVQEGMWLHVYMIEFARWCQYFLEEGFKWRQWAIGRIESWKYMVIWAIGWICDRPHCWYRIQCPGNSFMSSGDTHGTFEYYRYPSCEVCESICHECGEDRLDSYLVVWGNFQDWSNAEKLRPSTCLQFSGKWIISMIDIIDDVLHQPIGRSTCSPGALI